MHEVTQAARVLEEVTYADRARIRDAVGEIQREWCVELEPLAALAPGTRATIVRLAEHDGELLHWFYDQGFVPGREVEVRAAQPAAGQLTVRLDGHEQTIGEKAAAGLFVRPTANSK